MIKTKNIIEIRTDKKIIGRWPCRAQPAALRVIIYRCFVIVGDKELSDNIIKLPSVFSYSFPFIFPSDMNSDVTDDNYAIITGKKLLK